MSKYLTALAIAGAMSVPANAQIQQSPPAAASAQQAKPQMVKKVVCEDSDAPGSHIGRVCRTIMVPAKPAGTNSQVPAPAPQQPK